MPESNRLDRRQLLGVLGASSLGALGGCSEPQSSSDSATSDASDSTATSTVVFTDSTDQASTSTTTAATGSSTQGSDSNTTVFDGGDTDSFAAALQEVKANPGSTLEIEPGTYRFEPVRAQQGVKWRHFNQAELEDVTIEGNGATIIFTEPAAGGFQIDSGSDITIRNLTFDYDPIPFTQGTIRGLSEDRQTVEVELDEGYPPLTHEMFEGIETPGGSIHTADGEFVQGLRKKGPLDTYYTNISKIGERRYEMQVSEGSSVVGLQVGIKQLFKARRNVGVLDFYKTVRPTLENVTVHASNGAGFSFGLGKEPEVRNCTIAPPAGSDRLIGLNADGVRFVDVESAPVLSGTRVEYIGDDPIVVQQNFSPVAEVIDDHSIRLGEWPIVAQPGDTMRALSQQGERFGALPPIESVDLRFSPRFGGRGKPETITFEEPISDTLSETDLVGNTETGCHDFVVRNNTVRNARGNLVRIAASHGVVEDNTLEGAHRNCIEVECDTNDIVFIPKGGVTDVTLRKNDISRPGLNYRAGSSPSGIRVHHNARDDVTTTGTPNRDITIEGNTIRDGAYLGIEVEHAGSVRIEGNEMHDLNQLDFPETGDYGVVLDHVETGSVIGNRVTGSSEYLDAFGMQRRSTDIEATSNVLEIDEESRPGRLLEFVPVQFSFDKTVTPPSGDRVLAARFFQVSLLDVDGEIVMETSIGGEETGFKPGAGVYGVEERGDDSWRWFGSESGLSTMYLYAHHLEKASTMRLTGKPIEEGITGTVSVDGRVTDSVNFGETDMQVYEVSVAE